MNIASQKIFKNMKLRVSVFDFFQSRFLLYTSNVFRPDDNNKYKNFMCRTYLQILFFVFPKGVNLSNNLTQLRNNSLLYYHLRIRKTSFHRLKTTLDKQMQTYQILVLL